MQKQQWKQLSNGSWITRDGSYVVNRHHDAWVAFFQVRGYGRQIGEARDLDDAFWMCRKHESKPEREQRRRMAGARR